MATSKPISTISYNTLDFLVPRLESLVAGEILQAWFFIPHQAETHKDDEVKGKPHIHLLLMPNKRVDLVKLAKMFVQVDPAKPDKPLKCMPFRPSNVSDWLLYALHDPEYLALKGMEKEFHYYPEEIITSDADFLGCLLTEAYREQASSPVRAIREAVEKGLPFDALCFSGRININQVSNAQKLYDLVNRYKTIQDDEKEAVNRDRMAELHS